MLNSVQPKPVNHFMLRHIPFHRTEYTVNQVSLILILSLTRIPIIPFCKCYVNNYCSLLSMNFQNMTIYLIGCIRVILLGCNTCNRTYLFYNIVLFFCKSFRNSYNKCVVIVQTLCSSSQNDHYHLVIRY